MKVDWIPVSDHLPEYDNKYYIFVENEPGCSGDPEVYILDYQAEHSKYDYGFGSGGDYGQWWEFSEWYCGEITHWAEIPYPTNRPT